MKILRVKDLSKSFGGVHAVNNVSFSVEVGERLAVIGPNGAGKTTLFNLINGQLRPTAGRIYFCEQDITKMPTHQRAHAGQGRSFQLTSLFLNLTVLENTLLALHGTKPSRYNMLRPITGYEDLIAKAEETLKTAALWEQKYELVKNISYGEQRRLEISLTTVLSDLRLLLLDEPSCGLTAAESAGIIEMIRRLGKNITVLLVAHDMDLVFGVAERIIVLHYGEILADGEPKKIQTNPLVKEIYMGTRGNAQNAEAG
jgi:branched-chain amino acid transport system ATP-binding protein